MNVLIIEDEKVAAERLAGFIKQYDPTFKIFGPLQSVKRTVEWFENNPHPELIFMDIQLSDGLSFEIFEQTEVRSPVIFTTAYDEYALRAFKVNSIDYLLKPLDFDELSRAIHKFRESNHPVNHDSAVFESILNTLSNNYKNKFVIKVGERLKVFTTEQIQCFYSMEKAVFLQNFEGRDYAINYSLDQLEEILDPTRFFRINRKFIIGFSALKDIISFSNSRLQVKLINNHSDDLVVSRERVQKFKQWLEE